MGLNQERIQKLAKRAVNLEASSIKNLTKFIDKEFSLIVEVLAKMKGRIVVTGIGKSANIANKIVSTFNSTGSPAIFMHAADAIHGDLGMVQNDDVVLCISKSGNSPEIKVLIPLVKNLRNKIIGMTADKKSFLGKHSDFVVNTYVEKEACPNNLAPTTSTTAQLVMGDVLAVCLMEAKGFSTEDFARYHPGGALGKKIYLKIGDLVSEMAPQVKPNDSIGEVILSISKGRVGAVAVLDKGIIKGIVTDGDLRRMLEEKRNHSKLKAKDIMSLRPKKIDKDKLAVAAFNLMEKHKINQIIVSDKRTYLGMVHIHDLLKEGIY